MSYSTSKRLVGPLTENRHPYISSYGANWIIAMTYHEAAKPGAADQRRGKRNRVFLTVLMRWPSGSVQTKLTNISSLGACGNCAETPAPGTEVELVRGDLRVPARIVWSFDGMVGLEFAEAVDAAVFRVGSQHSADTSTSAPHLKPVERISSKLERHWTEIWNR